MSYKPYKPKKQKKPSDKENVVKEKNVAKTIQWFPGHMAKARREITESLKSVDIVIELCDARIPYSSRNPVLAEILAGKPSLVIMNKCSLADPVQNKLWKEHFEAKGQNVIFTDCITGEGIKEILPKIREILHDKLENFKNKGMIGRLPRAMIVGITNAGKSTLINKLYGKQKAKAENKPGVTRIQQWIKIENSIELLDTPGILWPKFEEEKVGLNLAYIGSIRDEITDKEEIAVNLCKKLVGDYPTLMCERYKVNMEEIENLMPHEVFELMGKRRGFLISGGEVNYSRTADIMLSEFRNGMIGRITLEKTELFKNRKDV